MEGERREEGVSERKREREGKREGMREGDRSFNVLGKRVRVRDQVFKNEVGGLTQR